MKKVLLVLFLIVTSSLIGVGIWFQGYVQPEIELAENYLIEQVGLDYYNRNFEYLTYDYDFDIFEGLAQRYRFKFIPFSGKEDYVITVSQYKKRSPRGSVPVCAEDGIQGACDFRITYDKARIIALNEFGTLERVSIILVEESVEDPIKYGLIRAGEGQYFGSKYGWKVSWIPSPPPYYCAPASEIFYINPNTGSATESKRYVSGLCY